MYHAFLDSKTDDRWRKYCEAKRAAKKAVAVVKAAHYADVGKKLDAKEGERLAKSRKRQMEDIEKFHGVNAEHDHLLMDRRKAMKRWRDYFERVSTEEFAHPPIPYVSPTYGPVQTITTEETEAALKRMMPHKVTGPDDVAVDLWKSQCWESAEWLARFFKQIVAEKDSDPGMAAVHHNSNMEAQRQSR